MNYPFCPNISLPENKKRIKEVGLDNFYQEYYESNFDISPQTSVMNQLFVDIDNFSDYQQKEIINSIKYQLEEAKLKGITSVNTAFDYAKNVFQNQLEDLKLAGDDWKDYVTMFSNIVKDFDRFKTFTIQDLSRIGVKIIENKFNEDELDNEDTASIDTTDEEDKFNMTEGTFQRDNYDDGFNFARSSKDTASAHLKNKLSFIPDVEFVDGKLEPKENFLFLPTFTSLDKIWSNLLRELSPLSQDKIYPHLQELAKDNPMYANILNNIFNDPNVAIQKEFLVTFSKQQAQFETIKIGNLDKGGDLTLQVFGTNRQNAANVIIEDWIDKLKQSPILTSDNGDYTINTDKSKDLALRAKDFFSNFNKEKDIPKLQALLAITGINISDRALQNLADNGIRDSGKKLSINEFLQTKVQLIFNRLAGQYLNNNQISDSESDTSSKFDLNNPYISEAKTINQLANLELRVNPSIIEDSYISGDGKAKYSYVNNSYISKFFKLLNSDKLNNYINDLSTTSYAKDSIWLRKLKSDNIFRENFKLTYLDTLGTNQSKQKNKLFKAMSTKEKEFTRIALFQNQGRGDNNIAKFIGLIPSDKTTLPIITTTKTKVVVDTKSLQIRNHEALDDLYTGFTSEYNRILDVQRQQSNPNLKEQLIQGYHNGMGNKFLVYDFLNNDTDLFDKDGNLKVIDTKTLESTITPKIQDFITKNIKEQLAYWKSLEIDPKMTLDKSYKKNLDYTDVNDKLRAFAADYVVNNFLFNLNYTQLISGDPALHGKKSVPATWINYSKRLAKDIAPGLDGSFDNPYYRTLFLKDISIPSSVLAEYRQVLGDKADAYANLNPADAQEYTTLKEHLAVMKAYGKLTPELQAAGDRLLAGGNIPEDIELILQPMKPVQVGTIVNKELGVNTMYYIKTSSFPLVPALTKGLEIDKLRASMEANNIDRAVYESGVKLGLQGTIQPVMDNLGNFNQLEDKAVTLNRDIFRIQQEIPYHAHDNSINEGSQGRKLILVDVDDNEDLNFFNKTMKGSEIKKLYEGLHVEKINRSFNRLLGDIGVSMDNNRPVITDLSKLQKVLIDEASSRNYNINDIYGLQIENINGIQRFKIPLAFNNSSNRLESILNALFTNRVIKQELPGFSKIQGSSVGFSEIRSIDRIDEVTRENIVWLDRNDTELKYIRHSEDGKTLLQADILVPSWFKDESGYLIDIKQFIDKDGNLDTSKIHSDLLTTIGLRIPTQGYNSIMSFKVKGFLPAYVGDLAIVPSEIVGQMGSDFDVDKLFLYRYEYNHTDGIFSKIKFNPDKGLDKQSNKAINNGIIQIFEDRYKDPNLLGKILEPNGFGELPTLAKDIAKQLGLDKQGHFLLPETQNQIHKNNNDGRSGTGIFSLFSTFIKAAQDAKLELEKDSAIIFKVGDKLVSSNSLYGKGLTSNNTPSNVISYFQSASVDNAKEQILGSLNINSNTMDVAGTIALAGFDERYIAYFLSQPIIRSYVDKLQNANDITNPTYDINKEDKIIQDLLTEQLGSYNNRSFIDKIKSHIFYSLEDMKDLLGSKNEITLSTDNEDINDVKNKERQLLQTKILLDFIKYKNIAKQIRSIQSAINVDTNGLGAKFSNLQVKMQQIDLVASNPIILNTEYLFNENTIEASSRVLANAMNTFSQILPYNTVQYNGVKNSIIENMGKAGQEINSTDLQNIYSSLKSYIYSDNNLLDLQDVSEERNQLIFGKDALGNKWEKYTNSPAGKKNLLTQRIKVRRGTNIDDPIRLEALNTPATNSSDNNEAMTAFYRMYYRGSNEEKNLAKDLVKYYILTGGQQGPNSISKYIPYDILEENKFSNKLNDINDGLYTGEYNLENFVEQYFQHNPNKAVMFSENNVKMSNSKIEFTIPKGSQYEIAAFNEGGRIFTYPKYMSIYDGSIKNFRLYKIKSYDETEASYQTIDLLGSDGITEYNKGSIQYSIFKNNKVEQEIPQDIDRPQTELESLPIEDSENIELNTAPIKDENWLSNQLNLSNNSIESTLDSIINNPTVTEYANIAKDLKQILASYPNIKIGLLDNYGAAGQYYKNEISINLNNIVRTANEDPLVKAQRVILHETLHAITVNKIDNYNHLSEKDKKSVDKLQVIFNQYKRSVDQEELKKYNDLASKYLNNKDSISNEDKVFLTQNRDTYYPLTNLKEFVAAGLTDDNFSQKLKSNNFWKSLWNNITNLLGLNKNYNSDYEALYDTTLELGNSTDIEDRLNNKKILGVNISSKSEDPLGRALTNPNWGSKKDGRNYLDVETLYKNNASKIKASSLNAEDALKYDMNLMYKLQVNKFEKNPELIDEINKRGGLDFILNSSHIIGVKNSRWEGKGLESNFIKVLSKSYETVSKKLGNFIDKSNNEEQTSLFDINIFLTPREQKKEFLTKYHLKDGQSMSPHGFDAINKSMKANSKYDRIKLELVWEYNKRVLRVFTKGGTPLYDISPEETPKSQEQKFNEEVLKRLLKLRSKFIKQTGFKDNLVLQAKVAELNNKISRMQDEFNMDYTLGSINTKLDQIERRLNSKGLLNQYDVQEFESYLTFYRDISNYIKFNEAFEEDNKILDSIETKSKRLLENLQDKKRDLLLSFINSRLNVKIDIDKLLTSPQFDAGKLESELQSGAFSSNQIVQLLQYTIEDNQLRTNEEFNQDEHAITSLVNEFLDKYKDYTILLQKDKNGNNTGRLINKYSQEYYDELAKLKGDKKAYSKFYRENTKVELNEEGKKTWNDDLNQIKEVYPDWNKEGTHDKAAYTQFYASHDPNTAIKDYQKTGNYKKGAWDKYISKRPIDKWLDSNYSKLKTLSEEDPARRLYDLLDTEFRPLNQKYDNQVNYIPEISKDLISYMIKGNIKGGFNNIKASIIDSLFSTVEAKRSSADLDINGNPHDIIPVYMMSDKLSPEDKSYDLGKILLSVKAQEAALKHKSEIEPYLIMMKEIAQSLPQYVTNNSGEVVIDENDNPLTDNSPLRNAKMNDQMRWIIEDYLYNKGSKQSNFINSAKIKQTTTNTRGEEVETEKVLTGSKIADSLSAYTRLKGMGLNIFSGMGNVVFGLISNSVYAGDRTAFGEKESIQALGIMLSASIPGTPMYKKVGKLMKTYDVLVQTNEIKYGQFNIKQVENPLGNLSWYELQKRGEYFVQGQTAMAMLLNKQVKDSEGKTHSMFDAYDDEGNWKPEFGEDPMKNRDTKLNTIKEIRDVISNIHGDYARGLKVKEHWLGRAMLVFRTWLPQSISNRFGKEYTDLQGLTHKGRYRSLKAEHALILPFIRDTYKAFTTARGEDTIDTRNLRKNAIELAFVPVLWAAALFLKSMIKGANPDDDKKALIVALLNLSTRAQSDLTFFYNPYSFKSVVREPIPAFKTLMDIYDIGPAVYNAIAGDDIYKSGRNAGKSKLYKQLREAFPLINQPDKIKTATQTVLGQNPTQ